MNNFTKSSGRAYWHSITNSKSCSPGFRKLQNNGIKALLLLMFFTLSSGAMFAQVQSLDDNVEIIVDSNVDDCMHDVPVPPANQDDLAALMGVTNCVGILQITPIGEEDEEDGELHVQSGFAKGSDNCNWTYYYVYTVKCDETDDGNVNGEQNIYTLTYSGGDHTKPWLTDPKDYPLPKGEKGMSLCYQEFLDMDLAPSADAVAALYTDNCSHVKAENQVTKRVRSKNDDCSWIQINTYTIHDLCKGNDFEVSITYEGGDDVIPTFDSKPADLTGDKAVYCDEIPDAVELSWSDNCSKPGKVWSVDDNNFDCNGGFIFRSWDIKDDCGNVNTYEQKIEIKPAKDVVFDEPESLVVNVPCDDRDNYTDYFADELFYTNGHLKGNWDDLPDYHCIIEGYAKAEYDAPDLSLSCSSFDVTYSYDDECNTISQVITVNIVDDIMPVINKATDPMDVECGDDNEAQFQAWLANYGGARASDNCDENLEWESNLGDRTLSDDCGETGEIWVFWTIKDDCGNQVKTGNRFRIIDTTAPDLTPATNRTYICDGSGNVDQYNKWIEDFGGATAQDDCSDVTMSHNGPILKKYYDDKTKEWYQETLLDYVKHNPPFVVDCDDTYTGTISVTFTATDDCNNSISTTASFTIEDTLAPVITPAMSETVECDGTMDIYDKYDSPDEAAAAGGPSWPAGSNIALFHEWLWNHGGATATEECSEVTWWIVKNETSESTPNNCYKTWTVKFYAGDNCKNSDYVEASFTIEDTMTPIITEEAHDVDVECYESSDTDSNGISTPFQDWLDNHGGATAYDFCDKDLTWSHDAYDGKGWNQDCGNTTSITVIFTVTDNCGMSSTTAAEYAIVDTLPPVFNQDGQFDPLVIKTSESNVKCPEDAALSLQVGDEIGVNDTWTVGGVEIQSLYGYVYDNCSDAEDLIIRVTDTTNSKDNCDNVITITFEAEDECGNISKEAFKCTYIIVDDSAPTYTGDVNQFNISDLNACEAPAPPAEADIAAQFSDNCNTVTATLIGTVGDPIVDVCGWGVQFAYEIKDSCNNVYDGVVKVTYWGSDQTAPQPTEGELPKGDSGINSCLMDALDANPGSNEADVLALFTDNCKDAKDLKIVKSDVIDDTDYDKYPNGCTWAFHYEFTVSDNCGNDYVVYENFSGEDKLAPRLLDGINLFDYNMSNVDSCINEEAGPSEDDISKLFIECGDVPGYGVNVTRTVHTTGSDCNWITSYEYEVSDDCGNEYPAFKITHSGGDDTAPDLTGPGDEDFGEVDGTPDFAESADYTDCGGDGTTYNYSDESDHYHDNTGSSVITVDINCYNTTFVTFIQNGTSGGYATYASSSANYSLYHSGNYWYVERHNIFPGIVAKKYDTSPGVAPCSSYWSELSTLCGSIRSYCSEEPGIASHFELTRTFTAVDACGNESTTSAFYTWTIDGKAHSVDELAVAPDVNDVELNFKAYPVPFNKDVNLNYNFDFDTDVTIEVYDTKGLLVKSQVNRGYKAGSDVVLPMSIQGADQLYYVKLITNRGTVTKKIVSSNVNKQ